MGTGVYKAYKKDKTEYFRAYMHYKGKHISLGNYMTEGEAAVAYIEAKNLTTSDETVLDALNDLEALSFEKAVSILNFKNTGIYFGAPIYLEKNYFRYYLNADYPLLFDREDLFYYSEHKILSRGGYLFVNDYGSQINILSRYGIRNHSVKGVDYIFKNGNERDLRYENVEVINPWNGVKKESRNGITVYQVKIHLNGYYQVGIYKDEITAAIAYNKACDMAKASGINTEFSQNYVLNHISAKEYAAIYSNIRILKKLEQYLKSCSC